MAIILCGAAAGTNTLVQLDDPTTWEDEGVAQPTPFFVSADVDRGPAGGTVNLRRIVQAVTLSGDIEVTVTPIANGSALVDQAEAFTLVTTDGPEQRIEHGVSSTATRHAVQVELTDFGAAVVFGEADMYLTSRRTTERA